MKCAHVQVAYKRCIQLFWYLLHVYRNLFWSSLSALAVCPISLAKITKYHNTLKVQHKLCFNTLSGSLRIVYNCYITYWVLLDTGSTIGYLFVLVIMVCISNRSIFSLPVVHVGTWIILVHVGTWIRESLSNNWSSIWNILLSSEMDGSISNTVVWLPMFTVSQYSVVCQSGWCYDLHRCNRTSNLR